jgi:hypothetical protein
MFGFICRVEASVAFEAAADDRPSLGMMIADPTGSGTYRPRAIAG